MFPIDVHHTHVLAVWQTHDAELFNLDFQMQEYTYIKRSVLEEILGVYGVEKEIFLFYTAIV